MNRGTLITAAVFVAVLVSGCSSKFDEDENFCGKYDSKDNAKLYEEYGYMGCDCAYIESPEMLPEARIEAKLAAKANLSGNILEDIKSKVRRGITRKREKEWSGAEEGNKDNGHLGEEMKKANTSASRLADFVVDQEGIVDLITVGIQDYDSGIDRDRSLYCIVVVYEDKEIVDRQIQAAATKSINKLEDESILDQMKGWIK